LSRITALISLALASSGICNSLQKCNLELEARVGIGRLTSDMAAATSKLADSFLKLDEVRAVMECGLGEQTNRLADE
jgi:hypothetical protein